ncbi:MAG: hypothetical protein MUC36_16440 [Planctomycetes bacterium]|jgi:hypothetical protein|nr:hypothetical protein [Planctomycetota bacterium]
MLYPEDPGNLARVADNAEHRFFKRYGESMPAGFWNHPGTKQGIYMIGPDGEYLEGKAAANGEPRDIEARLQRALAAWDKLRKQKKYANRPVPAVVEAAPPEVAGKALILRASLRDLPRGQGASAKAPSRWRRELGDSLGWRGFVEWAWNQNWIGFDDPRAFVTDAAAPQPVADDVVRRLCREVLVDNVRGQQPWWEAAHVRTATLTMRRVKADKVWRLEYQGEARMQDGDRAFAARLRGEAEWDPQQKKFVRFELIALGDRRGAGTFNQRSEDLGPAPMGVALRLFAPQPKAAGKAR